MKELIDFVVKSLTNPSHKQTKFCLGKLSNQEIAKLRTKTGFDLADFERIIDNFAIRHAFSQHGNPKVEEQRGQIAITINDFENIVELIENFDKIETGEKNTAQRDLLKYSKDKEVCKYVYVEEIRTGKKELAMQTMYKQKSATSKKK
jgi:valyl-tRNA synthetase